MDAFFINYGWIIIILAIFIIGIAVKAKKEGKDSALAAARELAFELMLAAQKKFGQDAGEEKFKYVVERFYQFLPDTAKIFFTQTDIEKYIQKLYDEFMDFLDNGKIDDSFDVK